MTLCKKISISDYQIIASDNSTRLIDIREPDEHQKEYITGAENKTLLELTKEPFKKDEIVVFHCQSGTRTEYAINFLSTLGIDESYILHGGINAWKKAGFPVVKNKKLPLPLMRQVQIVSGLLIIIGLIFGYILSPLFHLMTLFVGVGLLFAGITGYCGLARFLMLLPYNKNDRN